MWQRARQVEPQTTQHFWAQAHLGAQAHPQCRLPLPVHRSAARPISTTVPINNGDREGGSAAAEKARVTAIIASRRPTKGIREETATATTVATTVTERKNAVSRKRPTKLRQNTSANTAQLDRDLSANFVQLDHSNPLTGLVAHTACLPTSSQANGAFYLDSGATQHMSFQRSLFTNFRPVYPASRWISGIGQSRVEILGTGDIQLAALVNEAHRAVTLHDALYAPTLGINLVSVGSIAAKGGDVRFANSQVSVVRDGVLLLTGKRVGDSLYRLHLTTSITPSAQPPSITTSLQAHTRPLPNSIQEWHERLAHLNYQTIIKMARSDAITGLSLPPGTQPPAEHCHPCAAGKLKRCTFNLSSTPKSTRIGMLISCDLWGPAQTPSLGGAIYCSTFRDDCSDYRAAYYLKSKDEVAGSVMDFIRLLHTQTGQLVACIRTDGGTEYHSKEFEAWLRKKGIRHETTIRHTPQQNGLAERDNRTLFEGARTLLASNRSLPLSLWAEATNHKAYVLNRSLSSTCPTMTPHEAWYGSKPDLSSLRTFGTEFYTLVPKQIRKGKLEDVGVLVYFVGNSETQKGERFYDPSTGKLNTSRDTTPVHHYYEPRLPSSDLQGDTEVFPDHEGDTRPETDPITPPHHQAESDHEEIGQANEDRPDIEPDAASRLSPPKKRRRSVRLRNADEETRLIDAPPIPAPRRSDRTPKPKRILSMHASFSSDAVTPLQLEEDPDQYQDAMASCKAPQWKAATEREYDSLIKNNTWELVTLPTNRSLIRARWTFKFKPAFKATDAIYKARFVAKGYSQCPGVDYKESEIYAPVMKHDSFRILCSIAAVHDLELFQLDVKTAFLYGDLDEELYVEQPEGFIAPGTEHLVCRLKKPLYGLVQSARKWNEKFDSFITKFGMTRSECDPCIYVYRGKKAADTVLLGVWVDDGILGTKTKTLALAVIDHLEKGFAMISKPASLFIGIKITRNRDERKIFLSQSNYIRSLLHKFKMANCNPSSVPADPNSRLTVMDCPTRCGKTPLASTPYRSAIGGLMYAARMTRPDILFAVTAASRYNQDPGNAHWAGVKRILSYLAGTVNHGLCYGTTDAINHLIGYSDSDFAGCEDSRRSTSGIILMLNGGPISWISHLQKPIANSTAEAEYYAAGHASREIAWLRNLLKEIGFEQLGPTPLMCDNRSAVLMVQNPVFHDRTKHIDVKYHYVRQQYKLKNIEMLPVRSQDELADMLTKPLKSQELELNRSRIGVI